MGKKGGVSRVLLTDSVTKEERFKNVNQSRGDDELFEGGDEKIIKVPLQVSS